MLLPILSAVLLSSWTHPLQIWPLVWICLVPWLLSFSAKSSNREILAKGFSLSFSYGIITFYWVLLGVHNLFALSWISAFLLCLPMFFFHQPQFLLFPFVLRYWLQRHPNPTPVKACLGLLGLAFLYTWLDSFFPKLFLDTLGDAFIGANHLRQAADIGGLHVLSFLAIFMNLGIWYAIRGKKQRSDFYPILIALVLALSASLYGFERKQSIDHLLAQSKTRINALVIQANINYQNKSASQLRDTNERDDLVKKYVSLSQLALQTNSSADFIVWPETSYPGAFREGLGGNLKKREAKLETLSATSKIPLVFGSLDIEYPSKKLYNSIFLLEPSSRIQIYHKNFLLLFGERWPGAEWFPFLTALIPSYKRLSPGAAPTLLQLPTKNGIVPITPLICYEAIVEEYVAKAARLGGRLILNLSDDSWFGNSLEAEEHFDKAVFASIETRLPQIRSTNSGISALILPNGEIVEATKKMTEASVLYQVPIMEPIPTIYMKWGDWLRK